VVVIKGTMELKEIEVSKIYPNWFQPRKEFNKEKLQELTESILSNGLINPITIKEWRGKYMIVSGERRWRAHKLAKLKTIQAFVKEYKDDGQFMIDSLIENIHREDLTPTEKGKFCLKIKKQMGLKNSEELAKYLKIPHQRISNWLEVLEYGKKLPVQAKNVSPTIIYETQGLPEKERIQLIKKAVKEDFGGSKMRELVRTIKKSDEPTKKALLSGRVTIEQVKNEPVPEPIELERTANNIGDDILTDMSNLDFHINELMEDVNPADLSKSKMQRLMTTSGLLVRKHLLRLIYFLKERGIKPDPIIGALIKANGKI